MSPSACVQRLEGGNCMGSGGPHLPRLGAFPSKHGLPARTARNATRGQTLQAPEVRRGGSGTAVGPSTSRQALHALPPNGSSLETLRWRARLRGAFAASPCFRTIAVGVPRRRARRSETPCLLGRIPPHHQARGGERRLAPLASHP